MRASAASFCCLWEKNIPERKDRGQEGRRTERERKRGGRKKETGLGGDDGGGGQKLQGTKSLKKLGGRVGENKDTCTRGGQ